MLEKYLNKEVIIEEKLYNSNSTVYQTSIGRNLSMGMTNITEGILTNIDNDYIEVDNKMLIARKYIYRISLK